jgi:adenylate kinase
MVGERLAVPQISTGDILREAAARKTDLGTKAKTYMDGGQLVPDDIMLPLVENRIEEPDCRKGYVLDGFPRTLAQAIGLDEVLRRHGQVIEAVIFIDVSDNVVLERLSNRRVCPKCNALYNLGTDPPRREGVCDRCGIELILRKDDESETVRTRLGVYRNGTLPLVEYYESRGILRKVDGEGDIAAVFSSIMDEISEVRKS